MVVHVFSQAVDIFATEPVNMSVNVLTLKSLYF